MVENNIKAIFGLLVNDVMSRQSAIAVVLSMYPAVVANELWPEVGDGVTG